jgi:hypothetical protein
VLKAPTKGTSFPFYPEGGQRYGHVAASVKDAHLNQAATLSK